MRILIIFIFFVSCQNFKQNENRIKIARVNSNFLYLSDLKSELSSSLTFEDSIIESRSIIDDWAIKNLVYKQSLLNLDDSIQKKLSKKVENYKLQLWSDTYRNFLSKSNFNITLDSSAKKQYYAINKGILD